MTKFIIALAAIATVGMATLAPAIAGPHTTFDQVWGQAEHHGD